MDDREEQRKKAELHKKKPEELPQIQANMDPTEKGHDAAEQSIEIVRVKLLPAIEDENEKRRREMDEKHAPFKARSIEIQNRRPSLRTKSKDKS